MQVKLMNNPTIEFIDSAVGQCWDKGPYGTGEEGIKRIDRVCNKMHHSSMLRFATYIFEVELSTSALLEWTRHQVGVDYAVKSTRYCTKQNPDNIAVELSNNHKVNQLILQHTNEIIQFIKDNPTIGNDDLKLLLPQAFIYKMQVQFNAQSLQHFLFLRSAKGAHYHIRDLAKAIYDALPMSHRFMFQHIMEE